MIMNRKFIKLFLLSCISLSLASCDLDFKGTSKSDRTTEDRTSSATVTPSFNITEDSIKLTIGEKMRLSYTLIGGDQDKVLEITWESYSPDIVSVDQSGEVQGLMIGEAIIFASVPSLNLADYINIEVIEKKDDIPDEKPEDGSIVISVENTTLDIGDSVNLVCNYPNAEYYISSGEDYGKVDNDVVLGLNPGTFGVKAVIGDKSSKELLFTVTDNDPYENISSNVFYSNYKEAISYSDAKYRTQHYFMSGSLDEQIATPTIDSNRPTYDGKFIRNSNSYYSENNNAYTIVDSLGNEVDKIFKGGAYVTLEQVAAYVFAFGSTPSNQVANTKTRPSSNGWGKYLRVNDNYFSNDVKKYPNEPELPKSIQYNGKIVNIDYHEMDIGTTGTDTGNGYPVGVYNNGKTIVRGAARICYSYFENSQYENDVNTHFVFYTYNHYNDFQEYLNYFNGWGEKFGLKTAGGSTPTPYVESVKRPL